MTEPRPESNAAGCPLSLPYPLSSGFRALLLFTRKTPENIRITERTLRILKRSIPQRIAAKVETTGCT